MNKLITVIVCLVWVFSVCSCTSLNEDTMCRSAVLKEFAEADEVWATKTVRLDDLPNKSDFDKCYQVTVYTKDAMYVYIGGIKYYGDVVSVDMDLVYSITLGTEVSNNDVRRSKKNSIGYARRQASC